MVEWSKAAVCKTDRRNPHVGSNPTIVTKSKENDLKTPIPDSG